VTRHSQEMLQLIVAKSVPAAPRTIFRQGPRRWRKKMSLRPVQVEAEEWTVILKTTQRES
jgi:hypothetical protein